MPEQPQRFVVGQRLGAGGMGAVHVATDTRFDRLVALKVMSDHLASGEEFRERFRREADVLTRLESPHVTTIYDHGESDGHLWIATQLVRGGELGELLRVRGPLPPHRAVQVCGQVAEALRATHAVGVLHRDVKPSNVLLRDPDAANLHAYLCDFGIADTGNRLTVAGGVAGTWQYLAPERASGSPAAPTTDIYAVGCLLWACLAGQPPYTGSDVDVAIGHLEGELPQVPETGSGMVGLNLVLRRTMAKNPAERFQSAAELRAALTALEAEIPVAMPPLRPAAPSAPHPAKTGRSGGNGRRGRLVGALALAGVLVAGGVVAAIALDGDDSGSGKNESTAPGGSTKEAVNGDLTGDGLGDLTLHDWDGEAMRAVVMPSKGSAFGPAEQVMSGAFSVIRGDIDGNGTQEPVAVAPGSGGAEVTVASVGGESRTLEVGVDDADQPDFTEGAMMADVTGDGRDDLVVAPANNATGDDFVVWLAVSTGDGFEDLRRVHSSSDAVAQAVPADVDGDGDDDVVLAEPDAEQLGVLESDGKSLSSTGFVATNTTAYDIVTGDFDGDGVDEVVEVDGVSQKIVVLRRDADAWDSEIWLDDTKDAFNLLDSNPNTSVSDVNGDGRDDLVRFSPGEGAAERQTMVFVSSGKDFAAPADWGGYTCECDDYFDPVERFKN